MRRPRGAALADLRGLVVPALMAVTLIYVSTSILLGLPGGMFVVMSGLVVISALAILVEYARRARKRSRIGAGATTLPLELRRAIVRGFVEELAVDLAIMPYTTAMTLHATLLEHRRLDVMKSAFESTVAVGFFGFAIAYSIAVEGTTFTSTDLATFGALVLFIPHFAGTLYWSHASAALLQSWGSLDAVCPAGASMYPRPTMADVSTILAPQLTFIPFFSTFVGPWIARASETSKLIFFFVVVAMAGVCHLLTRRWRRAFIASLAATQIVHPENLADILLDTDSAADRAFD